MEAKNFFQDVFDNYDREHAFFSEKADDLFSVQCSKLRRYRRLIEMNEVMTGGYVERGSIIGKLEESARKSYWTSAEKYVFFVVSNFPKKYMKKLNEEMFVTQEIYHTHFLQTIHINFDRFVYTTKRRIDDMHFRAVLNPDLFVQCLRKREEITKKLRNLFYLFSKKFSLRPHTGKWKNIYEDFRLSSTVEGELVFSMENYLDEMEKVFTPRGLNMDLITKVFSFIFATKFV